VPTARGEGPSLLFRNDLASGSHWLVLRLVGSVSNRSGIGAKVRVRAVIGGAPRWQMREILASHSFGGHHALEAHFGLGDATVVDSVRIEWPSGIVDARGGMPVDTRATLYEADAVGVDIDPGVGLAFSVSPQPLAGAGRFRFTLQRPGRARVDAFDTQGRRVATLADEVLAAGPHERAFAAAALPGAGLYFIRLVTADGSAVRRVARLR
jgi:hypothetical protein